MLGIRLDYNWFYQYLLVFIMKLKSCDTDRNYANPEGGNPFAYKGRKLIGHDLDKKKCP